jgi:hypothetical protein
MTVVFIKHGLSPKSHRRPDLLREQPGGAVRTKIESTLQFPGGNVLRGLDHEVHRLEPGRERKFALMKDSPCRWRKFFGATMALKDAATSLEVHDTAAFGTKDAVWPTHPD